MEEETPPARTDYSYLNYRAGAPGTRHYLWPVVFRLLEGLPRGSRVLDAGCGNGHLVKALAERGFEACGYDLSESGIAHARKTAPDCRIEILSAYDDAVAVFGRPFDAVVSLEVIEHLYDPRMFARRVHDALVPGGRLVVSTPYHGWLKNLMIALRGHHDAHYNPLWDGGHIKFWSRRTLSILLEEQGFSGLAFHGAGRLPWLWMSMVMAARRPAG